VTAEVVSGQSITLRGDNFGGVSFNNVFVVGLFGGTNTEVASASRREEPVGIFVWCICCCEAV